MRGEDIGHQPQGGRALGYWGEGWRRTLGLQAVTRSTWAKQEGGFGQHPHSTGSDWVDDGAIKAHRECRGQAGLG